MAHKTLQDANLAVGYVAKRSDVNVSTLHFYETKGLIRSWRNNGNQRRYKPDVLRRIAVIKAAQKMGVTLEEIKLTLDTLPENRTPNKNDWARLSTQWQAQLDEKIAYMQRLRERVEGCIGCGCLSMSSCPLYNPNDILGETHSGAVLLEKD
ncbi:redox-sensitive transcriptional activator SoxR [Pseudoalteromonas aurantia]|uniref:Redox-sensitive transcriptional activator SoxR n=1 Tax=Pseudoalteromonas aurantia TaxID=43654 RepID=A0A5S3V6I6_9GAMM|nr:redox-sensitive transcriptional activator SoxR [Pseudoalteromonas aurantia]TMO56844.1 redox-sensitive transcriptional activator SoxR [Pseudoalteromonas aurantia]TMO66823.1 redox-sensitive transcriptional activator SoxR [Pseudoalteromonas aurantia]TMO70153.1 redox-sensitive transcriptional activator SoxR [Pseudoalteromonas aurantia]